MKKLFFLVLMTLVEGALGQSNNTFLFVGTYTDGKPNHGIYVFEFNAKNGKLKKVCSGESITNPSFLTLSPNGNYVYACTDTKLPDTGSVAAFQFNYIKRTLTLINKQPSGGENPVYVTTSRNNEWIVNANYSAGTVSVFKTNVDGSLNPPSQIISFHGSGPNARRQEKAHIHAAVFSPDFEYLFFPDLGADKIRVCKFNGGNAEPILPMETLDYSCGAGSGPRHFTFHPNQRFAYCVEELSGTITAFNYENGKLDSIQRVFSYSKLQDEYNSADIHVSPDGKFLYASNRWDNENTIAIFSIDTLSGKLKLVGHQSTFGDHPRNFTLDPTGNFLLVANQVTNNIVVFKRDVQTGLLTKVGKEVKVPSPSCLRMWTYEN